MEEAEETGQAEEHFAAAVMGHIAVLADLRLLLRESGGETAGAKGRDDDRHSLGKTPARPQSH